MNKIRIVNYTNSWPDDFLDIAEQIRALVDSEATRIDHIGSTSVPGLAAKNVIDIQITVENLPHSQITSKLQFAGYRTSGPYAYDNLVGFDGNSIELRKVFLLQPRGQRWAHIHVREEGRINQLYALLFRDYLRADPTVREAYEMVKLALADRFPGDIESYYAIKDPYMDTVYRAALLWKDATGWKPDANYR